MSLLFASLLFLQAAQTATVQQQKPTNAQVQAAIPPMQQTSRSVMIIDPKTRAEDYAKAFEMLKTEKSTAKVFFELADGSKISNVIDMKMMPGNSLIIFRYNTPQGILFQVVAIEDIVGIRHQ